MTLLDINKVSINFGGVAAVSEVDMKVMSGEIHGLIGPNGAGKTTLFNLISGVHRADSGSILLNGRRLHTRKVHDRPRFGLSRTFQNVNIFGEMTAVDNVKVGFHPRMKASLFKYCLRTPGVNREEEKLHRRAFALLDRMGLKGNAEEKAKNLSYGHQKLLEIARALACNPMLLLLDEPGTGMNPAEKDSLKQVVKKIKEDNITMVLIEHDMSFVMDLCDPITVLYSGVKIAEGSPKDIRNNHKVIEAYLGRQQENAAD